ncbi:MAG: ATP-binding cassette domain-containing protein [Lachnospiraceae bacterium]|nr:ATP-binding cassette domain-containing protein [Lachnospiraceae bacterium]MBR1599894.1 ATP-binding cassette domain-containing protein [Lachnospiraceae bacterium]
MERENSIEVHNLTKDYKKGRGIFDFNFEVKKGEVFGLIGTNGSGKTTTIRHMMGFIHGDSGKVNINGLDAWKDSAKIKQYIGYVPGQIDFPDVGTGTDFLKIQSELLGLRDMSYMNDLIDRFKIDITAPLRRMSKGMKQKMALVAAFMSDADIYILDEPSTGLDPLMRDTLIQLILEKKAQGKTVFMSSHIFKEVEDTCDTVMFIRNGHIVNLVRRSQFENDPHEAFTVTFASDNDYKRYLEYDHYMLKDVPLNELIVNKNQKNKQITLNLPMSQINEFLKDLSEYSIAGFSNEAFSLEKYYTTIVEKMEV